MITENDILQTKGIRETLLDLPDIEVFERWKVRRDVAFYEGKYKGFCNVKTLSEIDRSALGQTWINNDNLDYEPSQEIHNKIKVLIKRQSRWMFGERPTLNIRPDNSNDRDTCEAMRKWFDDVLDDNDFWTNTLKADQEKAVKKRILLRLEAKSGEPFVIKYESLENFYTKSKNNKLMEVKFFAEDDDNVYKNDDAEKIYYLYRYYYKTDPRTGERKAWLEHKTYKGAKEVVSLRSDKNTGFNTIPCWLIKNGGGPNSNFGESDVEECADLQMQYNKTCSDFREALRFMMFGTECIVDGAESDVNRLKLAPNCIHAIHTDKEAMANQKQAKIDRQEYTMSAAEAIEKYLKRLEDDMNYMFDMPQLRDLTSIPSAKAMVYLYNDVISRCSEKWNDWSKAIYGMLKLMYEIAPQCYKDFKQEWIDLKGKFSFDVQRKYPIPPNVQEEKTLAINEVVAGVRSHRSYIEEYSKNEDYESEWRIVLDEKKELATAEVDEFTARLQTETANNIGTEEGGGNEPGSKEGKE